MPDIPRTYPVPDRTHFAEQGVLFDQSVAVDFERYAATRKLVEALKHSVFAMTSVVMLTGLPKPAKDELMKYVDEAEAALERWRKVVGG
jgi:hypothetical protein